MLYSFVQHADVIINSVNSYNELVRVPKFGKGSLKFLPPRPNCASAKRFSRREERTTGYVICNLRIKSAASKSSEENIDAPHVDWHPLYPSGVNGDHVLIVTRRNPTATVTLVL